MKCFICDADDGLTLMCGRHWSEYTRWQRQDDIDAVVEELMSVSPLTESDDERGSVVWADPLGAAGPGDHPPPTAAPTPPTESDDVERYARERWPNLMAAYDEAQPTEKCDGEHGAPECDDRDCWQRDPSRLTERGDAEIVSPGDG